MRTIVLPIPRRPTLRHPKREDVLELLGFVLLVVGIGAIYWPAGVIVAGLLLIAVSYLTAEKPKPPQSDGG